MAMRGISWIDQRIRGRAGHFRPFEQMRETCLRTFDCGDNVLVFDAFVH
jgi:hypothetical protein